MNHIPIVGLLPDLERQDRETTDLLRLEGIRLPVEPRGSPRARRAFLALGARIRRPARRPEPPRSPAAMRTCTLEAEG